MKKLLFTLLALAWLPLCAQTVFFRNDTHLGTAMTTGVFKGYGLAVYTEPKIFFLPVAAAGLHLEGDVIFGGKISPEATDELSVGMSSRAAILAKGEYYVFESKVRPIIGFGTGYYAVSNVAANGTGGASATAGRHWGIAPEVGVTFGNFRLSAMYHVLFGKSMVALSSGEVAELSNNYFSFTLGFRTFGIGDR